jgi:hypothetical protein
MLGLQMLPAQVRVLAADEAPTTVVLSPPSSSVRPGGNVVFTATLDIPALVTTTVALSVTPSNAGTLPASVDVAPGALSATFTYTDTSAGAATVTASFLASTSSAAVAVDTVGNHLVINEVDYDQPGTDGTEFVEIYNPTGADISLANKALVLVNGANKMTYDTIDLGPAVTLPSHQFLIVAGPGVTVAPPALKLVTAWTTNAIQNGGAPEGDGVALVDTATHTLIDALSYVGSVTMANIAGFPSPVSLVEGTVLPTTVADSGAVGLSLCRSPNGTDTDNAMHDWKICTTPSVGTSNP